MARILLFLTMTLGLTACDTIDWKETGNSFAAAGCGAWDNCTNVCPDGQPTDPRFPNCESPVRSRE